MVGFAQSVINLKGAGVGGTKGDIYLFFGSTP